jgi:lipopolysaccharide biosynthesis glycosyltransferase
MRDAIRVVVAADEGYVMPMAACIRSIIDTLRPDDNLEVAVLSCGISGDSEQRLERSWQCESCNVEFIPVDETLYGGLPIKSVVHTRITHASYAVLFLGTLLPSHWGRVIYLDVDTISRASIEELWKMPLEGQLVGAAQDDYVPTVASRYGVQGWQELGIDDDTPYFNSGVLLVDLDAWRKLAMHEEAVRYIEDNRHDILQSDQEALNAVVKGEWLNIGTEWNVTNYWRKSERRNGRNADILNNAKIRHFTGPLKPWVSGGATVPDAGIFFDHLKLTSWGK